MLKVLKSVSLTFAFLAGFSGLAYSQESSRPFGTLETHQDNQTNESELEDLAHSKLVKSDSIASKQFFKKTAVESQKHSTKQSEESNEPFNFLYFIISRFKTSDIVDN